MRAITPIAELRRRIPEQGRLRFGQKVAGRTRDGRAFERPKAIDVWRFTTADRAALDEIAARYGGTPEPWRDGPRNGEWQLTSTSSKIDVALPPDPLSQAYEAWAGGRLLRRCDGTEVEVPRATPDGSVMDTAPCRCKAEGKRTCTPKTRLSVLLRHITFGGVWRLDTGSWNAAEELPGMVEFIASLEQRGLAVGQLVLAERSKTAEVMDRNGKVSVQTSKFIVPALVADQSLEAIVGGLANVQTLDAAPSTPALSAGSPATPPESGSGGEHRPSAPGEPGPPDPPAWYDDEPAEAEVLISQHQVILLRERIDTAHQMLPFEGPLAKLSPRDLRHAIAKRASRGRTDKINELHPAEFERASDFCAAVVNGEVAIVGVRDDGWVAYCSTTDGGDTGE